MLAPDEERRLVIMLSTAVFLDPGAVVPVRHIPPGYQWSGWHVSRDVFNSILHGAGHWHPERA